MDITDLAATPLAAAILARELSCREVMSAYLARIGDINPRLNAIVNLRQPEALMREAGNADAELARGTHRGFLHGMPLAIKDAAPVAGLPCTLGSPLLRHYVPSEDGLMPGRLRAAGAIMIGKTNTPEFGLGSHTFNEVFGVTRNAYDPSRSAGGSSGGAAVALAAHLLPIADGSDFMGSLRNPAGWNNVFGMRPSQNRVPRWPAEDIWVSLLSTEGPMGRTVEDLARLLDLQSGPDPRLPLSLPSHPSFATGLDQVEGTRAVVGWLGNLGGYLAMEPGILEVCEAALQRLAGVGGRVEPIAPGFSPEAVWQTWLVWRRWLVAARIAPHLGKPGQREQIKPEALWEHDQGAGLSGAQALRASGERSAFFQQMLALFERVDVLALPSAQVWPFDAALRWPARIGEREMDTYHRWMEVVIYATLAGLPCISVPAGFNAEGLPMGLQLIGRPQGEAALLRVARACELASADVLATRPAVRT